MSPEAWNGMEKAAVVHHLGGGTGPREREKTWAGSHEALTWVPPSSCSSCLALRPLLITTITILIKALTPNSVPVPELLDGRKHGG